MEVWLLDRRRGPLRLAERRAVAWPPSGSGGDCVEDRRCTIRFVWTFSTGVGVGVRLRRAAAAAAEDRLVDDGLDFKKAWLAALCADCDADVERG